ncbi:MAG: hypothetical protein ACJ8R9_05625 [Steroidobacteraceae bacterium]
MNLARAIMHGLLDLSPLSVSVLLSALLICGVICACLGWRAWKQDSLGRLSDNILGIHGLTNCIVYVVSICLFFYYDGFWFGFAAGWFFAIPVALLAGYVVRGFVTFSVFVGISLAQFLRVPQSGSIFNDPRALGAMTAFLREHASRGKSPSENGGKRVDP